MDPEMLTDLLDAAIAKAACAQTKCLVSAEINRWYFSVVHLNDTHVCPFHSAGEYPSRVVSIYTLLENREALVQTLANWLSHLHENPAELGGGGSASGDADAGTSTPHHASALIASDASGGDRVGSVPGD